MPLKLALYKPSVKFSASLSNLAKVLTQKVGYKVEVYQTIPKDSRFLLYGHQINKHNQFTWFKENNLPGPDFTTEISTASSWQQEGHVVLARTKLASSEGAGITVVQPSEQLPQAPLYVKYQKKASEFRVHVFKDKVVTVLEKRKSKEKFNGNHYVRNTCNGYVFCHQNVEEPVGLRELALKARGLTQSDFAGVDVIYNKHYNKLMVLEVNSAPGMENTTLNLYAESIIQNV